MCLPNPLNDEYDVTRLPHSVYGRVVSGSAYCVVAGKGSCRGSEVGKGGSKEGGNGGDEDRARTEQGTAYPSSLTDGRTAAVSRWLARSFALSFLRKDGRRDIRPRHAHAQSVYLEESVPRS